MNSFEQILKTRFPTNEILSISYKDNHFLLIDFTKEKGIKILMSTFLHTYQMPVPEKLQGYEYGEIFFCIPEYWDLTNPESSHVNWLFEWLIRVASYTKDNSTWLGDGHTYNCTKYGSQLSNTCKQDHLFVSTPVLMENELTPILLHDKTIHFWALIPLFGDEMDYKQGKGTVKLKKKFLLKGVTEKLDEFRQSCLRNRWLFFK